MDAPGEAMRDSVRSTWVDPTLLCLLGVGLALRALVAWAVDPHLILRGDEGVYLEKAAELARRGVLDTGTFIRPPLYFIVLAALDALTAPLNWELPSVVRGLQCVVGTAVAVPVYRTTTRIVGRRGGLLAAAFLLFDPTLIAYCHLIWPETLFLLVGALVFDGIAELEQRSALRVASLGVLAGLALLLKPAFGIFALLLAAQWLWRLGGRETLRLVLIFGGVAAVVISPWVIHNQLRYGPAIILENQGPYNLWIGNDPAEPRSILREWNAMPDPVTRSRVATERGLAAIENDPARFGKLSLVRALNFWGLEFFVVRHAVIGGYHGTQKEALLRLFWVIQTYGALLLIAAASGLRRSWQDPTLRLLVVHAIVFTIIVSAMVTTTRFRVPFAFLTSISAGIGIDALLSRRLEWRDFAAIACAVTVLCLSATRPVFQTIGTGRSARETSNA
ncbi:MAG: glycosyltransferase family 39 protein [Deltaproteobacteria bacterium]|nr:glycosyltransferase family 39 protein [Deltaproteobacteria bacterium]